MTSRPSRVTQIWKFLTSWCLQRRMGRATLAVSLVATVGTLWIFTAGAVWSLNTAQSAAREPAIPNYAQKIAGRAGLKYSWDVWLFGLSRDRACWGIRNKRGRRVVSEFVNCGYEIPERPWQLIAREVYGTRPRASSALIWIVRPTLKRLLITMQTASHTRVKRSLEVQKLTPAQMRRSRLHLIIGYARVAFPGIRVKCTQRIVGISESGRRISGPSSSKC